MELNLLFFLILIYYFIITRALIFSRWINNAQWISKAKFCYFIFHVFCLCYLMISCKQRMISPIFPIVESVLIFKKHTQQKY